MHGRLSPVPRLDCDSATQHKVLVHRFTPLSCWSRFSIRSGLFVSISGITVFCNFCFLAVAIIQFDKCLRPVFNNDNHYYNEVAKPHNTLCPQKMPLSIALYRLSPPYPFVLGVCVAFLHWAGWCGKLN